MKKLWRLSHLWLAIFSFLFMLMAGITGAILAVEPLVDKTRSPEIAYDIEEVKIEEVVTQLKNNYDEVFDLSIDKHNQIIVNLLNFEPELDGEYVFNPHTLELSPLNHKDRYKIFEWSQTLHRSLFLETTGRNIMAIMAVLLFFIIISGVGLIVQRQQGWKNFYHKIISSHFSQFSHVWLGRIFLFPLLIVTLSAIVLSLERLGWAEKENAAVITTEFEESAPRGLAKLKVLENKTLADINKIEFPFSTEPNDYYRFYFKDEIVDVSQATGQVLSREKISTIQQLKPWAKLLHTGRGAWLWAVVLLLSSMSVIYFVISGSIIFWKRTMKKKDKNSFSPTEAEYVILYGSENGSTKNKAQAVYQALIKNNKKAFITSLNNVTAFSAMRQLVVVTSTYGHGDPPENAKYFLDKIDTYFKSCNFCFSVVGFGAKEYPQFCQFAKACQSALSKTSGTMLLKPVYINHQNKNDFKDWWNLWTQKNNLSINFDKYFKVDKPSKYNFEVIHKTKNYDGYQTTFNLWLKPQTQLTFQSGDLLAVAAPGAEEDRFYSLSRLQDDVFISVKLHPHGLCSNYMYQLKCGDILKGYIKPQPDFHYNPSATSHTYIANGTGLGPFIGMIHNNPSKKQHIIFGLRNNATYKFYEALIDGLEHTTIDICYSRENQEKKYVQHTVEEQIEQILNNLKQGGEIFICGNLAMGNDVLKTIEQALYAEGLSIDNFVNNHQIKMDCY